MSVPFEVELFQTIQSSLETVTGRVVRGGFPVWSRGGLQPPLIAVALSRLTPSQARPGSPISRVIFGFSIIVYGADEASKLEMIGEVLGWCTTSARFVIQNEKVGIGFVEGRFLEPSTSSLYEQYAFEMIFAVETPVGGPS